MRVLPGLNQERTLTLPGFIDLLPNAPLVGMPQASIHHSLLPAGVPLIRASAVPAPVMTDARPAIVISATVTATNRLRNRNPPRLPGVIAPDLTATPIDQTLLCYQSPCAPQDTPGTRSLRARYQPDRLGHPWTTLLLVACGLHTNCARHTPECDAPQLHVQCTTIREPIASSNTLTISVTVATPAALRRRRGADRPIPLGLISHRFIRLRRYLSDT